MCQPGASSSTWASAGSGEWIRPAGATYGDDTSSSSGLRSSSRGATLTQQMSELNIRVGTMEETMHQQAESTRDWQRMTGERLHTMEQRQQRQLEEQRAYYASQGFFYPPPQ